MVQHLPCQDFKAIPGLSNKGHHDDIMTSSHLPLHLDFQAQCKVAKALKLKCCPHGPKTSWQSMVCSLLHNSLHLLLLRRRVLRCPCVCRSQSIFATPQRQTQAQGGHVPVHQKTQKRSGDETGPVQSTPASLKGYYSQAGGRAASAFPPGVHAISR